MTGGGGGRDDGYALLVAVVAMAALAMLAASFVGSSRANLDLAAARIQQAKLQAAADAGVIMAVRAMSMTARERRWTPDGQPHRLFFDGSALTVRVEDERGKIDLNTIDGDEARTMFAAVGIEGQALDSLTDAFLDWRDPDDVVRPHGAERDYYAPLGRIPRNGPLRSIDELLEIRGMTPLLLNRLRPAVSVIGAEGEGFDERYAQPLALRVMGTSELTIAERERELAGEREALPLNAADNFVGRGMTIRVEVSDRAGGRFGKTVIVQLTGKHDHPFLVRSYV